MCKISQIRRKALRDCISKSKVSMETVYKDRMINCINAEEMSSQASIDILPLLRERN